MAYAAFTATFRVVDNASAGSKYGERARITLERFTEDLESLYQGESGIFEGEEVDFGGRRGDSLSFSSTAHLRFRKEQNPVGQAVIGYYSEEESGTAGLRLYRSDRPNLPGTDTGEEQKNEGYLLCDGVQEVSFTYIDAEGTEYESWSRTERIEREEEEILPRMVRIQIVFADADADADADAEDKTVYYSTAVALPQYK